MNGQGSDMAPAYTRRARVGSHESWVGVAAMSVWLRGSTMVDEAIERGARVAGLMLVDPSFTHPISVNLCDHEGGEGYSLIWSRPNSLRGEFPHRQGPGQNTGAWHLEVFHM